jgi:4-hydroxy-tetrahydrodipicolinate synthase
MKLMFKSPSPGPAKKALKLLGRIQDDTPRLPMTPADEETTRALQAEMKRLAML